MGKPHLILRLEGPLQSWGGRSRWDVRDTQPEPTKSGIIGLLGCALGYERGDRRLEDLDAALRLGVRVEHPGRVLEDFQTITDFLPTAAGDFKVSGGTKSAAALRVDPNVRPATILSPRFYLEDAAFLAVLDGPPELLTECAEALHRPRWTLFLGRKACIPTRPIFERLTEDYENLEQALRRAPWSHLHSGRTQRRIRREEQKRVLETFIEDPDGPLVRQDSLRLNAARQYGFRQVSRLLDPPVLLVDVYPLEAL